LQFDGLLKAATGGPRSEECLKTQIVVSKMPRPDLHQSFLKKHEQLLIHLVPTNRSKVSATKNQQSVSKTD